MTGVGPWMGEHIAGYIYAPLKILYLYDGLVVNFYIKKVVGDDGKEYWKAIPLARYIPIYVLEYDYSNLGNIAGNFSDTNIAQLTEALNDLITINVYSPTENYIIYDETLSSSQGCAITDIDTNIISDNSESGSTFSWFTTFLLNRAVMYALGSWNPFISTLAAPFLGVTWVTINDSVFIARLSITTCSDTPMVKIQIQKTTIKQSYLSDEYASLGSVPVVYSYTIIIVNP